MYSPSGFKRMLEIEAMDAITGNFVGFNEKNTDYEKFPDVIAASAAIPGVFSAPHWGNWIFIDGGVVWGTNLVRAV